MKKIAEKLKSSAGVLLSVVVIVILFPILILSAPFNWIEERKFKKDYQEFLIRMDGKNFFCYNSRSKSLEFIRQNVIPNLPGSVEVIFLNGRTPESAYERKFISHALYNLKSYKGFPHLFKIRNEIIVDISLNNELFNVIDQSQPVNELLQLMANFFELGNNRKGTA